jgi:hypothetical protein
MANLTWETVNSTYSSSDLGMRGSIQLFSVYYDSLRPKGEDRPYTLRCNLPGIKDPLWRFPNSNEAKEYAEDVFTHWLDTMRLQVKA